MLRSEIHRNDLATAVLADLAIPVTTERIANAVSAVVRPASGERWRVHPMVPIGSERSTAACTFAIWTAS